MNSKNFNTELATIINISKEYNAQKVWLFGSCLEDLEKARDIDIAVEGVPPREFYDYYGKLAFAVRDEVDVVDIHEVSKHVYNRIMSDGRIIYERP